MKQIVLLSILSIVATCQSIPIRGEACYLMNGTRICVGTDGSTIIITGQYDGKTIVKTKR